MKDRDALERRYSAIERIVGDLREMIDLAPETESLKDYADTLEDMRSSAVEEWSIVDTELAELDEIDARAAEREFYATR